MVQTSGYDIITAITHASDAFHAGLETAYLIPHRGLGGSLLDLNHRRTLLYVGPIYITRGQVGRHKVHHFLIDDGRSIGLHGSEFRYLSPCKT